MNSKTSFIGAVEIGTSKISVLIGEYTGRELAIIGHGECASRGVIKGIRDLIDGVYSDKSDKESMRMELEQARLQDMSEKDVAKEIKRLEKQMMEHAKNLDFEKAAQVRDQLQMLKAQAFGAPGTDNVVVLKA